MPSRFKLGAEQPWEWFVSLDASVLSICGSYYKRTSVRTRQMSCNTRPASNKQTTFFNCHVQVVSITIATHYRTITHLWPQHVSALYSYRIVPQFQACWGMCRAVILPPATSRPSFSWKNFLNKKILITQDGKSFTLAKLQSWKWRGANCLLCDNICTISWLNSAINKTVLQILLLFSFHSFLLFDQMNLVQ